MSQQGEAKATKSAHNEHWSDCDDLGMHQICSADKWQYVLTSEAVQGCVGVYTLVGAKWNITPECGNVR